MKEYSVKNAKIIHMVYGIIMFITLLSSLVFMTQYRNIRVNWDEANGLSAQASMNDKNQDTLYRLFQVSGKQYEDGFPKELVNPDGFKAYAQGVFDFRKALDAFNDLILVFAIIGLICFALTLIFSNHSRRVYYKSNLISGVCLPAVTFIFSIILIIKDITLMGQFNENYDLYNLVSIGQDPLNLKIYRPTVTWDEISALYSCNSRTFIIYIFIFALSTGYSLFLMIYAIKRYKASAEDRRNILVKAGVLND